MPARRLPLMLMALVASALRVACDVLAGLRPLARRRG